MTANSKTKNIKYTYTFLKNISRYLLKKDTEKMKTIKLYIENTPYFEYHECSNKSYLRL